MQLNRLLVLTICVALGACGGDGARQEDAPDEGESPPVGAPAPTPAPDPPSQQNRRPEANAGPDRNTVEEQDVSIDGSGTRDPDGDALAYTWRLVAAPAASRISVTADTPAFAFRADVPGTYDLELVASDGKVSDTDTMRVRVEALVSLGGDVSFKVDKKGKVKDAVRDLELETSSLYRGPSVAYTASADVPWLEVLKPSGSTPAPGEASELPVRLVKDAAEHLPNGEHTARVTVTPAGGWEQVSSVVKVKIERDDKVSSIVPYVTYTDERTTVALHGSGMLAAAGKRVLLNGADAAALEIVSDEHAVVELPSLAAGEYRLGLAGPDGNSTELGRIVVRDRPMHRPGERPVPGFARSLEYDAERDAIYAVFAAADGTRSAHRLQHSAAGEWLIADIPVRAPWAVALSADGARLYVASASCTVHELDPETLSVLQSLTKASCDPLSERFGTIATLTDGRVLVMNESEAAQLWRYPDFATATADDTSGPLVLNADADRLPWRAAATMTLAHGIQPRFRILVPRQHTAAFVFADGRMQVRETSAAGLFPAAPPR